MGYEITRRDFDYLVAAASRHHLKQVAAPLGLTVHTRRGTHYFRDAARREVSLDDAYRASQATEEARCVAHALFMYYAR